MSLSKRVKSKTPKFFATIRNIGLAVAAIGASILAAPVALPVVIVKIAGYLTVAGGIASAVSQATTAQDDAMNNTNE